MRQNLLPNRILYSSLLLPLVRAWEIISVASIKGVIAARGYMFFVILLYVMVGGLVAALGLCVQVGFSVGS